MKIYGGGIYEKEHIEEYIEQGGGYIQRETYTKGDIHEEKQTQ